MEIKVTLTNDDLDEMDFHDEEALMWHIIETLDNHGGKELVAYNVEIVVEE